MAAAAARVAVVTGANRGIGLEISKQLIAGGYDVVGACRKSSDALAALGCKAIVEGVDVGKPEGAETLAKGVAAAGVKVDLLVNNAGILTVETLDDLDWDRIQAQMDVNFFGPLRVATALLPHMNDGGKIGMITSRMGSIGDNGSGSMYGYRASKAALNMASVSLARDLAKTRSISVAILHPGMVATDMTARFGHDSAIPPEKSAEGILKRLEELNLENTGTFWHSVSGEVLPW